MEAQIIAQAGRKGAVTIATNMAGRGTDILLGGNPQDPKELEEVKAVGGLHVLGTERHEARRIDNQLRGRCGRQGDPGSSRFYLALDDELMRLFGSDRLAPLMERLGMTEGEVIESPLVSSQIANAQRRVETHNFDIRKQLIDYDNVMNKQREVIYRLRNEILDSKVFSEQIRMMIDEDLDDQLNAIIPSKDSHPEEWDLATLRAYLERVFGLAWDPSKDEIQKLDRESLRAALLESIHETYANRDKEFEGYDFREIEKMILLQMIDKAWKGHLYDLDHLKKSIGLRAYGQKDPKVEYQKESFLMFESMLARIREQSVEYLFKVEAPRLPPPPAPTAYEGPSEAEGVANESSPAAKPAVSGPGGNGAQKGSLLKKPAGAPQPQKAAVPADIQRIGRNDPCYCGSGKKFKKCHGA
jgi:preprotein translocase subunit SecA